MARHGRPWRFARLTSACLLALACAGAASAGARVDPALRFRTIATPHFVIYFHQGEEGLARRLAVVAEDTWRTLERPLGARPPARTRVMLVDQTDLANGWASPLPYDTISITATWPSGADFIGNTDDWLRVVFTHEFTHIVHLDRSEGWARLVRGVFGRVPLAFPNLFLPTWQIEGLATYEESVVTGDGRLHAGDFRAVVGEAARAGRLEPIDRVNGGLIDWPGGLAPYAYGLGFHQWLADRFGADRLAALADETARELPYLSSRAFRHVFGEPLGQLWNEYEAGAARQVARSKAVGAPRRLTHHGFMVTGPRFTTSCDGCPPSILYTVITPHELPSLYQVPLDGPPRRLITRYLGSTTGVGRRVVYFDQQEVRRNVALYADLYSLDRTTGDVRRLTREARLLDPDLSPDESTIAAVHDHDGRRDLVVLPAGGSAVTTLVSAPETQFNAPRWSPDGTRLAVERHRPGAKSEIVVVDVATRAVRVVASNRDARFVTPAWRPDGRGVIVAGAFEDGPFNLFEARFPAEPGARLRPITRTTGGATWPDVSSDGRTIVYAGYDADGFDLYVMPYPARGSDAAVDGPEAVDTRARDGGGAPLAGDLTTPSRGYSPWSTAAPTSWSPLVAGDRHQLRLGAAAGGGDVLGYHAYALSATWLVTSPAGAVTPDARTPDWQLLYEYSRWRPTLWTAASTATSFFAGPPLANGLASTETLRERQLEAGVIVPFTHVRVAQTVLASALRADDDYFRPGGTVSRRRTALRAGWALSSAHSYGYSISAEDGVALGATAEIVRRALGASGDATTLTADARAYLPGLAPHQVLALRLSGGSSTGEIGVRRTFLLGGGAGAPAPLDFGSEAFSLLRGFPLDTFAGSRVALVNADYRVPLARPERGAGTWPLFLRTVHGALFADAGHAWTSAFRARDIKWSAGAELSFDVVAGYWLPLTATVGAAWGRDGAGAVEGGSTFYVRVGRAF